MMSATFATQWKFSLQAYAITAIMKVGAFEIAAGRKLDLLPEVCNWCIFLSISIVNKAEYGIEIEVFLYHGMLVSMKPSVSMFALYTTMRNKILHDSIHKYLLFPKILV